MKHEVITGDALETMKAMEDETFDMIFTSPPYNLGNSSGGGLNGDRKNGAWKNAALRGGYGSWNDSLSNDEYIAWQKSILREAWRLLKPNGAIFYQHKNRIQDCKLQTPHDLNPDLPIRQIIIWDRGSGMNHNHRFALPSHEVIYVFAKDDFMFKRKHGLKDVVKLLPDRSNDHPAPFPVALPQMFIKALPDDYTAILDPFSGSGTTGVAAKLEGRDYTGIEIDPAYAEASRKRIAETVRDIVL